MTLPSGRITWVSALKAPVQSRLPLKCWPASGGTISVPSRFSTSAPPCTPNKAGRCVSQAVQPLRHAPTASESKRSGVQAQVSRVQLRPPDRSGRSLLRLVHLPAVLKVTESLSTQKHHSSDLPNMLSFSKSILRQVQFLVNCPSVVMKNKTNNKEELVGQL